MSLFDEMKGMAEAAEKAAEQHPGEVKSALDKLGEEVDKQTGGRHHDQIEQAEQKAGEYVDQRATGGSATPPTTPPATH